MDREELKGAIEELFYEYCSKQTGSIEQISDTLKKIVHQFEDIQPVLNNIDRRIELLESSLRNIEYRVKDLKKYTL